MCAALPAAACRSLHPPRRTTTAHPLSELGLGLPHFPLLPYLELQAPRFLGLVNLGTRWPFFEGRG